MSATVQTLVDFNGTDGSQPQYVNLLIDANGDLFGTTEHGGPGGYGTVFEITDSALTGYASTPTTLATFTNSTGENPYSGLLMDAQGNLFGTTVGGGDSNFGTAFEISFMPTTGYSNTPTTIANFSVTSSGAPVYAALVADSNGNLFGTSVSGGAFGSGNLFEIPYSALSGYSATAVPIVSFTDGASPYESLTIDANGDLFGTASQGGATGRGEVYELAYNPSTGYAATPAVLASFTGINGEIPIGSLIADSNGNLFGTTVLGGAYINDGVFEINAGTVFEIVAGSGSITTLASFNGSDGQYPEGSLIEDAQGNLFGTTEAGGTYNDGTVFEIAAGSGKISDLFNFDGANGQYLEGGLTADSAGNLFGVTSGGGTGYGTVFEVTDSGFVPLCFYPGTRIRTNIGEIAVETLNASHMVETIDGTMPIRWIGQSHTSIRFADPLKTLPIRIRAGALGDGLPVRDLLVSPSHAVLFANILVEASALVNGRTIIREFRVPQNFIYYHVELRAHSLIFAEGALAESFVDNVDRMNFHNWSERDGPSEPIEEMSYPRVKSARQVPGWMRRRLCWEFAA